MGIGTLRRHWSSEDTEEITTASTPSETGEVGEDGTENAGEVQETANDQTSTGTEDTDKDQTEGEGAEDAPQPPARSASKKDWVAFYEATGQTIPEDATRDSLAEAVLGPKE